MVRYTVEMGKNRPQAALAAWLQAGERLLRVDPRRLAELLELTVQFALAHENPDAPQLADVAAGMTAIPDSSHDLD